MMRAAGIPARVVTGYLGGDYQGNGNFGKSAAKMPIMEQKFGLKKSRRGCV